VDRLTELLATLEAQPTATRELVLRRFVEAWLMHQREAYEAEGCERIRKPFAIAEIADHQGGGRGTAAGKKKPRGRDNPRGRDSQA
jgi:hypothetical protein